MVEKLDMVKWLIDHYILHPDDVYVHKTKKYKVINRRGYKKIQAKEGIQVRLELVSTNNINAAVVKAIGGKKGDRPIETLGEVSPLNSSFVYPHSVAQSRAEGRLILEAAGLYTQGFITEDEIDEEFQTEKAVDERKKEGQSSVDAALAKLGLGGRKEEVTP